MMLSCSGRVALSLMSLLSKDQRNCWPKNKQNRGVLIENYWQLLEKYYLLDFVFKSSALLSNPHFQDWLLARELLIEDMQRDEGSPVAMT